MSNHTAGGSFLHEGNLQSAGGSQPACEISCLLCQRKFADQDIYGHVATDHFKFQRFGCGKCAFKSPYNDVVVSHLSELKHGFKPIDYGTDHSLGYVSRLVDIIAEQCRVASQSNGNASILADLDQFLLSFVGHQQNVIASQCATAMLEPNHNASAFIQGVMMPCAPLATSPFAQAPVGFMLLPSTNQPTFHPYYPSPFAATAQIVGMQPPSATCSQAAVQQNLEPAVSIGGFAPLVDEEGRQAQESNEVGSGENGVVGQQHQPKTGLDGAYQVEEGLEPEQQHEAVAPAPAQCMVCLSETQSEIFVANNDKEAHVSWHLSLQASDFEYEGDFFARMSDLWLLCFPDAQQQQPLNVANELQEDATRTGPQQDEGMVQLPESNFEAENEDEDKTESPPSEVQQQQAAEFRRRNARWLACHLCGEQFFGVKLGSRRDALSSHAQWEHTAGPIFKCDVCKKVSFLRLYYLRKHRAKCHPGIPLDEALEVEMQAERKAILNKCFPFVSRRRKKLPAAVVSANRLVRLSSNRSVALQKKSRSRQKQKGSVQATGLASLATGRTLKKQKRKAKRQLGRSLICLCCPQRTRVQNFNQHIWLHHMGGAKRHTCGICNEKDDVWPRLLKRCQASHPDVEPFKQQPTEEMQRAFDECYFRCFRMRGFKLRSAPNCRQSHLAATTDRPHARGRAIKQEVEDSMAMASDQPCTSNARNVTPLFKLGTKSRAVNEYKGLHTYI